MKTTTCDDNQQRQLEGFLSQGVFCDTDDSDCILQYFDKFMQYLC